MKWEEGKRQKNKRDYKLHHHIKDFAVYCPFETIIPLRQPSKYEAAASFLLFFFLSSGGKVNFKSKKKEKERKKRGAMNKYSQT